MAKNKNEKQAAFHMGIDDTLLPLWGLMRPPVREASILLNDPLVVILLSALLVLGCSYFFREWKRIPYLASVVLIGLLLGFSFKLFLQENRPCVAVPGKIPCPTDYGLPSLHALLAFALAVSSVGSRSFPIYLLYSLFIAFSRVYLGVHTITEVAAGLALAFFACVLAEILWRKMKWELPREVRIKHDLGAISA